MSTVVRTKSELEEAIAEKAKSIIVVGELAETLNTALKIKSASKWAIGLLAVALASIPLSGGRTAAPLSEAMQLMGKSAGAVAELTGLEIAVIAAIGVMGISLILLIAKDFKKVKFKAKKGDAEAELELERD